MNECFAQIITYAKIINMKQRRRLRIDRLVLVILVILLVAGTGTFGVYWIYNRLFNRSKPVVADQYDPDVKLKLNIPLSTDKYLLSRMKGQDNYVVYANNEKVKIYPASLTKLMTLKVALDNIDDLDETMIVNYRDLEGLLENDASVLGLNTQDEISIRNILYGLILPSGADCARLLERYLYEHDIDMITAMNLEAQRLGMHDTNFNNPIGMFDENNYTTLTDLNLLCSALMQNETAVEILETYYREDDGYIFRSTARNYESRFTERSTKIMGGKTGYLPESGLNYFAIIEETNGRKSLLLLAGCDPTSEKGRNAHFEDALKILDNYFE